MDTAKAQIPKANKTGYKEVTVKHCSFKKLWEIIRGCVKYNFPLKQKAGPLFKYCVLFLLPQLHRNAENLMWSTWKSHTIKTWAETLREER